MSEEADKHLREVVFLGLQGVEEVIEAIKEAFDDALAGDPELRSAICTSFMQGIGFMSAALGKLTGMGPSEALNEHVVPYIASIELEAMLNQVLEDLGNKRRN
jgi:hypothetical protein